MREAGTRPAYTMATHPWRNALREGLSRARALGRPVVTVHRERLRDAPDLLELGVVDEVVPEPPGGAHQNYDLVAQNLGAALDRALAELDALSPDELVAHRYDRFRALGAFDEANGAT